MKKYNAIILAAGSGKRLKKYTKKIPKCLVNIEGETILSRQIKILRRSNIKNITIVGGYLSSFLKKFKINLLINKDYRKTNMVWSLFKAKNKFNNNVIISYGDIVYHENILKKLMKSKSDIAVAIDSNFKKYWKKRFKNPLLDLETLKIKNNKISKIGKKTNTYKDIEGQYIGLIKLSKLGSKYFLDTFNKIKSENKNIQGKRIENCYLTDFLQEIIDRGKKVRPIRFKEDWVEIDTINDLKNPETIKRLKRIS
jgi:choline kinase